MHRLHGAEGAAQIDDAICALDRGGDRFPAAEVGANRSELSDLSERLEEKSGAGIAYRDPQPDPGLEQILAHIAADEAASAEYGNMGFRSAFGAVDHHSA